MARGVKVASVRLRGVDALRGLAIVLMVLDHVLLVTGELFVLRQTVTRFALPLFMLALGSLLAERGGEVKQARIYQLCAAGAFASLVFAVLGAPSPDVLISLVVTLPVWSLAVKYPVPIAVVAILQATNLPIDWTGYQPGYVLLFVCLGVLLPSSALDVQGQRLPLWLSNIGRYPLRYYVGHIAALVPLAFAVTPSMGRG